MTTAVEARVKQLKADERRSAAEARRDKQRKIRERAERDVAAEQRAADEAARGLRADEVEAELRATCTPTVTVRLGDGREVVVELGAAEQVERGTQVEAVRRLCYRLSEAFRSRVLASRNAGEVVQSVDFLSPMLTNDSDLRPAHRRNLLTIRGDHAA